MTARILHVTWITAVWLVAMGSFTVSAAIGGVLVGLVLTRLFHLEQGDTGRVVFRPLAILRFFAYFLARLAHANAQVALAVIRPARVLHRRAIVAVPVTECSETVVWFLANAVSLTPGTSIVELRTEPTVFYVHVLLLASVEDTRREVLEMQRRLLLAFGTEGELRDVEDRIAALPDGTVPGKEPA
jgi:multicomponent Na+:H+ antiporter subunit E